MNTYRASVVQRVSTGLSLLVFVLLAGLMSMSAAQAAEQRPAWVTSPNDIYPPGQYITGVGEGPSLDEARNQARGQVSTVFRQEIEFDQRLEEAFLETVRDNERVFEQQSRLATETRVRSHQELLGVEIGETICVESDREETCYALAYVNRSEARQTYRREIQDHDRTISDLYERYRETVDPIQRIRILGTAELTARRAGQLIDQYRVLHPGTSSLSLTPSLDELKVERMNLLGQMPVHIRSFEVDGPLAETRAGEAVQSELRAILHEFGFNTVEETEKAGYQLSGSLRSEPTDYGRDDGIVFVTWRLEVVLKDMDRRTELLSMNYFGESGGISESQAHNRALSRIESILNEEFRAKINTGLLRM